MTSEICRVRNRMYLCRSTTISKTKRQYFVTCMSIQMRTAGMLKLCMRRIGQKHGQLKELNFKQPAPEANAEMVDIKSICQNLSKEKLRELDIVDWVVFACENNLELFKDVCQRYVVEHGIEVNTFDI